MLREIISRVALGSFAILSLTLPIAAFAAPNPAPTMVPITKPDFSSMNFLLGSWACTTKVRGSNRPDTSTTQVQMDGQWMVTQDVAPPFDKFRTVPINGTTYVGYDSDAKRWVATGVDSFGGYGISVSPGWQGNTIVWTDKFVQGDTPAVTTITKISDTQTRAVSTGKDLSGNSITTTTDCKKTGS